MGAARLREEECGIGMKTVAIIVAAGQGVRMGAGERKQFLQIRGRPVLAHTLGSFEECQEVDEVILVVPGGEVDFVSKEVVNRFGFLKVVRVISGGDERYDSVYRGLDAITGGCQIVVIHDGVRPLVTPDLIGRSVNSCLEWGAAVVAVPPRETIKVGDGNHVLTTLDRDGLWIVQTPQTFRYNLIVEAYRRAYSDRRYGTDDASFVERLGVKVRIVRGSYDNIKITTPVDLIMAEDILKRRGK